jgi:hypothetical protein
LEVGNKLKSEVNSSEATARLRGERGFPGAVDLVLLRKERGLNRDGLEVSSTSVVALRDSLDRSPCGTGTSALAALLFTRGELGEGDKFVHFGIIGSQFYCKLTPGLGHDVVPDITGNVELAAVSVIKTDKLFRAPRLVRPYSFVDFHLESGSLVRLVLLDSTSSAPSVAPVASAPSVASVAREPRGGPALRYVVLAERGKRDYTVVDVRTLQTIKDPSMFRGLVISVFTRSRCTLRIIRYGCFMFHPEGKYNQGYSLSDV